MNEIYRQYMYSYPHKTAYYPIDKEEIEQYMTELSGKEVNLYVHLPFCRTKCGYCNLFSVTGYSKTTIDKYLDAIERQIEKYSKIVDFNKIEFVSLTLGGGTPSILSTKELERLFKIIEEKTHINPQKVMSVIELAPRETTAEKLDFLREVGFDRVSIGIQSFAEGELSFLRRSHGLKDCETALNLIGERNFSNFNIDLIYGIKGQTEETLKYSIDKALQYKPTEVFIYPLYIKPKTALYGSYDINEHQTHSQYIFLRDYLTSHGYNQISMRRFSRESNFKGRSCGFDNNLALGCGGRSYTGNLHFCEPFYVEQEKCRESLERFINKDDFTKGMVGWNLSYDEVKRRFAIKNLLHMEGISKTEYRELFKSQAEEDFPFLLKLMEEGFIKITDEPENRIKLTPEGMSLSDSIGPMFISEAVNERSIKFYK